MIRTTNSCCGNEAGLVEKFIGTAYDVVKTVYENLGELQFIYDFLNKYGVLITVSSVQELQTLPTTAKYTRVYSTSTAGERIYTDYLYVEGDRTGVLPSDPTATGSWVVVGTSTSGGSGSSGGYIPFVYNNGSALGGETTITVPEGTVGVPFIIVGGYTNYVGRGFTYSVADLEVTLAQPLETGDEVVLLLTGVPAVPDNPNVDNWTVINWLYNQGAAVGGEQVIQIPYTFQDIPAVYKNGLRFYKGLTTNSYTIDADNQRIILTEPLATNDRLIVQIGGEVQVVIVSDHTIEEVARTLNIKDSEVILSTDTTQTLNGKKVVYSVTEQFSYGLPTLPTNVYIVSVANGKLVYAPGNVEVDLLPAPYPSLTALAQYKALLASKQGTSNIGHMSPLAASIERSLQLKLADVLNIKDFGAIGDGELHPLSEKFSTLSAAQMVYPFVTDLSQSQDYAGTQAAIIAAKIGYAVFAPSGEYEINKTVLADYALCMYGEGAQGLRTVDSTMHSPSPVRGTVFNSHVSTGRMLSVDSGSAYSFGLTLRDFAIWGVDGQCDVGLYLNGIGWMGIVEGINIQFFPNQALEIGYIQDTYFTNCSFLQSGNVNNPAVTMIQDSNYVYFTGCHFELTPYMIKFGNPWFVFFNHCHFEVARPVSDGSTAADRFYYTKAPIDLGTSYRVFFNNNVFIPTDVEYLASKLSVPRKDVPYFITGSGSVMSFTGDTFMAPEGTIKSAYLSGTDIDFNGVKFIRCDPSNFGLYVQNGKVNGCSYGIDVTADAVNLNGIKVVTGSISNTKFGFYESDSHGKRTAGGLIIGGAHCVGNELPVDSRINIYVDSGATVNGFDGGKPFFVDITDAGDIDLTKLHPAANLRITGAAVSIYHVYGSPYGRDLMIASNTTDGIVKFAMNNLIPKGSVDYAIPQYHHTLWRCIDDGTATMYQIS
ncbi:tailspike protein [Salmonella phage FSL SP-076]|uniref:Tailspike protein n=1 Tax=Salmonella phage FSL SP-076 TaxID=1173762 RepID=S4TU85_9CAUD|nr:tail protein [Salmonella phage FSL SP-076]AGF88392.1 tailspike protein [Salmonella phage FSL SP-076]